jgi:hypothetical protein
MKLREPQGATPLTPDELLGLKAKHIATRGELNELEGENIVAGLTWLVSAHRIHAYAPDLGGEHLAKPLPPVPHGLMADLDPPPAQKILDISERQREPDVEHLRQTDDLWACLEVSER